MQTLLRIVDCAEKLGLGRTTIYRLIALGELSPVHIGRSVRISTGEIEDFIEKLQAERDDGQSE